MDRLNLEPLSEKFRDSKFILITSLRKPPRAHHYLKALGEGVMASLMMHNVCWVKTFLI